MNAKKREREFMNKTTQLPHKGKLDFANKTLLGRISSNGDSSN